MAMSATASEIIKSQSERLGKEVPTRTFPLSAMNKIVGALEATTPKFVPKVKDENSIWGDYRSPQTLLVLERTIEPVKGREVLQKVTLYNKDGLKVSANGDLNAILSEAGL